MFTRFMTMTKCKYWWNIVSHELLGLIICIIKSSYFYGQTKTEMSQTLFVSYIMNAKVV